jgi:hypothetical protein
MVERKRFLLRIDDRLFAALEGWAADELRSVNGQIEYLLTEAARRAGRLRKAQGAAPSAEREAGSGAGQEVAED